MYNNVGRITCCIYNVGLNGLIMKTDIVGRRKKRKIKVKHVVQTSNYIDTKSNNTDTHPISVG